MLITIILYPVIFPITSDIYSSIYPVSSILSPLTSTLVSTLLSCSWLSSSALSGTLSTLYDVVPWQLPVSTPVLHDCPAIHHRHFLHNAASDMLARCFGHIYCSRRWHGSVSCCFSASATLCLSAFHVFNVHCCGYWFMFLPMQLLPLALNSVASQAQFSGPQMSQQLPSFHDWGQATTTTPTPTTAPPAADPSTLTPTSAPPVADSAALPAALPAAVASPSAEGDVLSKQAGLLLHPESAEPHISAQLSSQVLLSEQQPPLPPDEGLSEEAEGQLEGDAGR